MEKMMVDNDSQLNPSAYFNTFKVSLTREQQKALAMLLPQSCSFQPFKATRSLDEESLKSEPKHQKSKRDHDSEKNLPPLIKEQKDPDYSGSYVPPPKDPTPVKIESTPGIPGGQAFMECYLILKKLKKSIYSWPFKVPVDPKALRIPEYFNVILQPMDLKTMEQNLKKEAYAHPAQFHRDIYKILMNSYKFNQKNSEVYATTMEFQEEYIKIAKDAKEGKLQCFDLKIKQEDGMISQSIMNFKESIPELERIVSASLPEPIKQTRPYIKKQKSQKPEKTEKPERVEKAEKAQKPIKVEKEKSLKVEKVQKSQQLYKPQKIEKIFKYQKQDKPQEKLEKVEHKNLFERPYPQKQKEKEKENSKMIPESNQVFQESKSDLIKHDPFFFNVFHSQEQQPPSYVPFVKVEEMYSEVPQKKIGKNEVKIEARKNLEEADFSLSTENFKRTKSKIQRKPRQKRPKRPETILQSPPEPKEFKETTQTQSQKTVVYNQIQKKLTDLLKRLNEYQMPNKSKVKMTSKNEGQDHPNCTNFTNITASQKKKLAEKISALPALDLRYVVEICYRNKRLKQRGDINHYEIDLEKLDAKILKELSNFVGMRIKKIKRESNKVKEEVKRNHRGDHNNNNEDDDDDNDEENEQYEVEGNGDGDEDYEPEERNSPQFDGDGFNQASGSFSNLLDHDGDGRNITDPNFPDLFQMIDSDDGHRRHPGDEYSNQFNF